MNNADSRRDNAKRLERLLTPFQKLVTLPVTFELHVEV